MAIDRSQSILTFSDAVDCANALNRCADELVEVVNSIKVHYDVVADSWKDSHVDEVAKDCQEYVDTTNKIKEEILNISSAVYKYGEMLKKLSQA